MESSIKQRKVTELWWTRQLLPASKEWRAKSAQFKFISIIMGLLDAQESEPVAGRKSCLGMRCVEFSDEDLKGLYHDYASQRKFRQLVKKYHLMKPDRSWLAPNLAKEYKVTPEVQLWHITEDCTFGKRKVTVEYDINKTLEESYCNEILKADGTRIPSMGGVIETSDIEFCGKEVVEAYKSRELGRAEFLQLLKVARMLNKGVKGRDRCRTHGGFQACPSVLRPFAFRDFRTGLPVKEVFDWSAAQTVTLNVVAGALAGVVKRKTGVELQVADGTMMGILEKMREQGKVDRYRAIYDAMIDLDPNTNVFGGKGYKEIRDTLKLDVQCVTFCDLRYLAKCEMAYIKFFKGKHTNANFRRQWLVWKAIKRTDRQRANFLFLCKLTGVANAAYRMHTAGEKMLMGALISHLNKCGFCAVRCHDAIYSADPRLTELNENVANKFVACLLLKTRFEGVKRYCNKALVKVFDEFFDTDTAKWIFEPLMKLGAEQIAKFRRFCNRRDDFGEKAFPYVQEKEYAELPKHIKRHRKLALKCPEIKVAA